MTNWRTSTQTHTNNSPVLEVKAVFGGSLLPDSSERGSFSFWRRITSVLSPKMLDLTHTQAMEIAWNQGKSPKWSLHFLSKVKNDPIPCSDIKLTDQPSRFHLPEGRSSVRLSGCVWSDPRLWVKCISWHGVCNNTTSASCFNEQTNCHKFKQLL